MRIGVISDCAVRDVPVRLGVSCMKDIGDKYTRFTVRAD